MPYFGERQLEELTHTDVREFELWRDRQLVRRLKTSTLNNFSSAWNRWVDTKSRSEQRIRWALLFLGFV